MADLGDQLNIQKQIQQLLQDRESLLSREKDLVNDQIKVVQKLCKAMKKCKPPGKELDQMSRSLGSASKNTDRFSEKLEDAAERAGELREKASGIADKIKGLALAGGGLLGLSSIFNKLTATAGGLFSALTSVAGAIFDIGLSILTIPLKVFSGIVEMAGAGGGGSNPLKQAMEDIREEFGSLASNEGKAVVSTLKLFRKNMKNVAQTGLRFHQIFAYGLQGMADVLKHNQELAVALKSSFNSMLKEFETAADIFYAVGKGLGFTADQQAALMKRSKRAGRDVVKDQLDMANMAIQMGRRFNVSSKQIGKAFGQMAEDADHFGHLTIEQMGAIATFANKLGLEIKELGSIIDKFLNFEDAAKGAAQLASGLGIMVDSLKMTNAAAAGDGAMIVSTLQDSFRQAGKTYDQLTFAQRRLVQQTTGMGEAAAQAAFGTKGLTTDYNDMTKAAGKANQEKMSTNDILKEMGKNIKRLVRSGGGGGFKGFFDAFAKGFARGVKRAGPFRKMLRTIRRALKATWRMGKAVGKMFVESFPGIKSMVTGLTEIFQPRRFKRFLNEIKDAFQEFFDVLSGPNPQTGVRGFLERIKDAFSRWLTGGSGGANDIMEGFKKFMRAVKAIILGLAPIMMEGLVWVFSTIRDFIRDPSAAGEVFAVIGEVIYEFFEQLFDAISPYLPELQSVISELGSLIAETLSTAWNDHIWPEISCWGSRMWDAIWDSWIGKAVVIGMVAKFFAPLLMILAVVATGIVKGMAAAGAGLMRVLGIGLAAGEQGGLGAALQQLGGGVAGSAKAAIAGAFSVALVIGAVGVSLAAIIWAMGQGKGLTIESSVAFFLLVAGLFGGAIILLNTLDCLKEKFPKAKLMSMIPVLAAVGAVMFGIALATSQVMKSLVDAAKAGVNAGMVTAVVGIMATLGILAGGIVAGAIGLANMITLGGFAGAAGLVVLGIAALILVAVKGFLDSVIDSFTDILGELADFAKTIGSPTEASRLLEAFAEVTTAITEGIGMAAIGLVNVNTGQVSDPAAIGQALVDFTQTVTGSLGEVYKTVMRQKMSNLEEFQKRIQAICTLFTALAPIISIAKPIEVMKNANVSQVTRMIKQQGDSLEQMLKAIGNFMDKIVETVTSIQAPDIGKFVQIAKLLGSLAQLTNAITGPMNTALSVVKDRTFMIFSTGPSADTIKSTAKAMEERTTALISGVGGSLGLIIQTMSRAGLGAGNELGMSPAGVEQRFKSFNVMLQAYVSLMSIASDGMAMFGGSFTKIIDDPVARGVVALVDPNGNRNMAWRMAETISQFMEHLTGRMGGILNSMMVNINTALGTMRSLGNPEEAKNKMSILTSAINIFATMARMLDTAKKFLPEDVNFSNTDARSLATMLTTVITGLSSGIAGAIGVAARCLSKVLDDPDVAKLAGQDQKIKALGETITMLGKFGSAMNQVFNSVGFTAGSTLSVAQLCEMAKNMRVIMEVFVYELMRSGLQQFALVMDNYRVFSRDYSRKVKNVGTLIEGFAQLSQLFSSVKGMFGDADVSTVATEIEKRVDVISGQIAKIDGVKNIHYLAEKLAGTSIPRPNRNNARNIEKMVPFIEQYGNLYSKVMRVATGDLSASVASIITEAQEVAAILNRTESLGFEAALDNFAQAVATGTGHKTYEIDPGRFNLNLTVEVKMGRKEMVGYLSGQTANATSRLQQKPTG